MQFYNQQDYTTCDSLVVSAAKNPGTAILQLVQAGIPQQKIVAGRPATPADANNGYMPPSTVAQCLQQAKGKGWSGGVMVWEYPNGNAQWIQTARAQSWPVS